MANKATRGADVASVAEVTVDFVTLRRGWKPGPLKAEARIEFLYGEAPFLS